MDETDATQPRSSTAREQSPPPSYDTIEGAPCPYEQVSLQHKKTPRTFMHLFSDDPIHHEQRRRCAACSRGIVWTSVVAFLLVVIGISVGVAVHTSREAHKSMADAGSTIQTTPSCNSTSVGDLHSCSCPSMNGTRYIASSLPGTVYMVVCDADIRVGDAGANGWEVYNLYPRILASSLQACIEHCAVDYRNDGLCTAVTFEKNVSVRTDGQGDCYLKNTRSINWHVDSSGQTMTAFLA